MSSTTSPPKASGRDDDLLDFLIAHHTKEDRPARCFAAGGRYVCARCLGWMTGTALSLFLAAAGFTLPVQMAYALPVPAFVDWGGRRMGIFRSGKGVALATGMIMGMAVPTFVLGALRLDPLAIGVAAAYLALFTAISAYARK